MKDLPNEEDIVEEEMEIEECVRIPPEDSNEQSIRN
jgi:hypothetical protein